MTLQPNEQVFYDADGIFISQYRFVTPDGSVYPTRTIERIWGSVYEEPSKLALFFLRQSPLVNILAKIFARQRGVELDLSGPGGRQRYWANFTFTGGGTYAGSANPGILDVITNSRTPSVVHTRSERQPDYAVWSYDEDWTRNLIAAANEAMLAAIA